MKINDLNFENNNGAHNVMLYEYQEAGQACRNIESLVRTAISLFAAIQAIIIGFIQTRTSVSLETILIEVFSIVVSVVTLFSILRLQMYYSAYMERAKCIERRLNMNLYLFGCEYMDIMKAPAQRIKNKKLLAAIPATVFVIFAILLVRDAKCYLSYLF